MTASIVTEHALLRYLQRVKGVDVEAHRGCFALIAGSGVDVVAARRELDAIVARGVALGAAGIVRDGVRYVVAGGRVVTVTLGKSRGFARQNGRARQRVAYQEAGRWL